MPRKSWREIRATAEPETIRRAEEKVQQMLDEMPLHELRQARQMTQETIADALGTTQANVSRMERRTDVYISTLRRYVEAMGGELEITAHFPDGDVRINQFHEVEEPGEAVRSRR